MPKEIFKKGQRVRFYLGHVGYIFATVVLDQKEYPENERVLLHIDGTDENDQRWISPKHVPIRDAGKA